MKTVRFPIFEDGLELQEYLEIDLVHFLGAAGSEVAHNHMRVVQQRTPEQEKEMIDRIIAGLPPHPFEEDPNEWIGPALARTDRTNPWREFNKREHIGEFAPLDETREIPGWSGYLMNSDRTIIDKETRTEVPLVEKGSQTKRNASVMLYHEDGGLSHMNVAWLFRQTFPELKK